MKIAQLEKNPKQALKESELNEILATNPPKNWVHKHDHIPGWLYIPIERIEWLLTTLFRQWHVEIKSTKQIFNSVEVCVRLHYKDPVNGWRFEDGVGCEELQTRKGTGVLKPDFSNLNRGAVVMAMPIAKSTAIKDAAEMIGPIFGGNLNRKVPMNFVSQKEQYKKMIKESEAAGLKSSFIPDDIDEKEIIKQLKK